MYFDKFLAYNHLNTITIPPLALQKRYKIKYVRKKLSIVLKERKSIP